MNLLKEHKHGEVRLTPPEGERGKNRRLGTRLKTKIALRDQILPVSINWPTNYDFALFSKLPTNYTKISEKIHFTYQNAPLHGAFGVFNIFSEIFV